MASILLVEDDLINREMIRRRLEWSGHQIQAPPTVSAAIELIVAQSPDLVLLDLGLPDLDGWQLAQIIRSIPGARHTPIIALTARTRLADHERSLQAGCNDVEIKPIDFKRLLEKIAQLTDPHNNGVSPKA